MQQSLIPIFKLAAYCGQAEPLAAWTQLYAAAGEEGAWITVLHAERIMQKSLIPSRILHDPANNDVWWCIHPDRATVTVYQPSVVIQQLSAEIDHGNIAAAFHGSTASVFDQRETPHYRVTGNLHKLDTPFGADFDLDADGYHVIFDAADIASIDLRTATPAITLAKFASTSDQNPKTIRENS